MLSITPFHIGELDTQITFDSDRSTKKVEVRDNSLNPDIRLDHKKVVTDEKESEPSQAFKGQSLEDIKVEDEDIIVTEINHGWTIELSIPLKDRLKWSWELSVVVKVLGISIGYKTLCLQLKLYGMQPRHLG
ncbi:unnamed protein product [Dovyalis caffra]|uniref:Uncharacterized protein n=1 Tax=Dovyalis caffra TaxID=77055 RepID=A0AAV1R2E8_9ROSI|nr:unnamed protein product [Dovyalis caffra]